MCMHRDTEQRNVIPFLGRHLWGAHEKHATAAHGCMYKTSGNKYKCVQKYFGPKMEVCVQGSLQSSLSGGTCPSDAATHVESMCRHPCRCACMGGSVFLFASGIAEKAGGQFPQAPHLEGGGGLGLQEAL